MAEPPLSLDRFAMLADAYGGTISRWPEKERAAATRLASDPAARAILAAAGRLDASLDAWTVPTPTTALRARLLDAAPRPGARTRVRLWWSGVGIAAALAGAAAGGVAAAAVAPSDQSGDNPTAFGDLAGQES